MLNSPTFPACCPLFFFWVQLDSARQLPVGPHEEKDLLARVMSVADIAPPGIGDRVYQNMVRRYRVCVEVAGRHIEPLLISGPRRKTMYSKQQKWESSTYCGIFVAGKRYVFGHDFLCKTYPSWSSLQALNVFNGNLDTLVYGPYLSGNYIYITFVAGSGLFPDISYCAKLILRFTV